MRTYTLTNEDYYKAEIAIYNDLPQTILYNVPKSTKKKPTESFKKHLLEGEKYEYIDYIEETKEVVVTSYGRIFNTITGKQLKPLLFPNNLTVYYRRFRLQLPKVFKKFGWEFNLQDISDRYADYGWKIGFCRALNKQEVL